MTRRDYERLPDGSEPGTYRKPKDGWVCFHCGVRFLTEAAARAHFGKTPNKGKVSCQYVADVGQKRKVEAEESERLNVQPGFYYGRREEGYLWHALCYESGRPAQSPGEAMRCAGPEVLEVGYVFPGIDNTPPYRVRISHRRTSRAACWVSEPSPVAWEARQVFGIKAPAAWAYYEQGDAASVWSRVDFRGGGHVQTLDQAFMRVSDRAQVLGMLSADETSEPPTAWEAPGRVTPIYRRPPLSGDWEAINIDGAEHFGTAPGKLATSRKPQTEVLYSYYEMCGDKTVWHRIDDGFGEPVSTLDEAYAQARIDAREIGRVNFTITIGNRSDPAFKTMNSATVKLAARRDFDSVTEATGQWRVV